MLHRFIAYLICFFMVSMNVIPRPVYAGQIFHSGDSSEKELFEKYPNAKVIRVTAEEYQSLEKKLQQQGYRQSEIISLELAKNDADASGNQQTKEVLSDDCADKGDESAGEESFRVMVDLTEDMMRTGNGSSSDEAAVLFVIVGTVVVIFWALYVFKYLYDISVGSAPCGHWNELTAVSSRASTSEAQHARFAGLRYATGFREGILDVGISFELGKTDILLSEIGVLALEGRYWLLGPVLRWRLSSGGNPSYFQMNFVGGTTEHEEVGLLAKASMGLLFGIGDSMQLGLNWGALNINLNGNQGIITERSQYHYLYGVTMGFKF